MNLDISFSKKIYFDTNSKRSTIFIWNYSARSEFNKASIKVKKYNEQPTQYHHLQHLRW